MLGFFATYSGLLYNEFFSLPLNIFSSCYDEDKREMYDGELEEHDENNSTVTGEYTYLRKDFDCTCVSEAV